MTERPIRSAEEDTLGRAPFAAAIAAHVVSDAFAEGGAVGLCGPWGSGKSSILALVEEQLRERPDDAAVVVRFNPWLFAGAEQLVARFFFELSAQLRTARERRLLRLADALETYGTLVEPAAQLPVAGSWLGLAARTAVTSGGWLKRRNGARASLEEQRDRLRDHLTRLGRRLVVVVDDVDRLRSDEIRDVVRLVRLTGSFPQMVYLLAFDRTRVEQALDETGTSGRAYLEKIMQVIHDVPALPPQRLRSAVSDELHRAWEAAGASGDPAVEFFDQLAAIDTV